MEIMRTDDGDFKVANAFVDYFQSDFELPEVSINDVKENIKKLKFKKSVGIDNILSYVFKE